MCSEGTVVPPPQASTPQGVPSPSRVNLEGSAGPGPLRRAATVLGQGRDSQPTTAESKPLDPPEPGFIGTQVRKGVSFPGPSETTWDRGHVKGPGTWAQVGRTGASEDAECH